MAMYVLNDIRYFVTDSSITLFWKKPEGVPKTAEYRVIVDGLIVGEIEKTHYTVELCDANRGYDVRLELLMNDAIVAHRDVGVIRTAKTKKKIDVTKAPYYAAGDGVTMNTAVLQRAIDDCDSDDVLFLPAGVFLTGALRLHSDMEIYLEEGAVLQGTDQVEDYLPRIHSRFEGIELSCYSSVLNMGQLDHKSGFNCKNVFIHGKGTIASGGEKLGSRVIEAERERLKDYLAELGDKINECENSDTIPGRVRPRLINISNCQNIILSGLTLKNGASWNVHMIYSDDIVTHNCTFVSEGVHNGDGWDPDSSTNCSIFGCEFFTGDDSVAIKSGKNPEGNIINRPSAHIRVFDCISRYGHGVTIGSEMSGGIEDVKIWDCDLKNSVYGIEIKGTKKRGGYVRNVEVKDCVLPRVQFHSVGYNDDGEGAPKPPVFESCRFERVEVRGAYLSKNREWCECPAIELRGFDAPGHEIRNIVFRDVVLGAEEILREQQIFLRLCRNISLENISCI